VLGRAREARVLDGRSTPANIADAQAAEKRHLADTQAAHHRRGA